MDDSEITRPARMSSSMWEQAKAELDKVQLDVLVEAWNQGKEVLLDVLRREIH